MPEQALSTKARNFANRTTMFTGRNGIKKTNYFELNNVELPVKCGSFEALRN